MSGFLDDGDEPSPMAVGSQAPDFTLDTERGEPWRLSEHLGSVTALLFYPQDETLVCTKQMCAVRDNWQKYLEAKAIIVGISPGTMAEHSRFSEKNRLPMPLLVDENRKITRIYGSHWLFPVSLTRAIVIVDAKGIIRHREIMLRAFRPTNESIIASIYAARADNLYEHYSLIKESYIIRNPFSRR